MNEAVFPWLGPIVFSPGEERCACLPCFKNIKTDGFSCKSIEKLLWAFDSGRDKVEKVVTLHVQGLRAEKRVTDLRKKFRYKVIFSFPILFQRVQLMHLYKETSAEPP